MIEYSFMAVRVIFPLTTVLFVWWNCANVYERVIEEKNAAIVLAGGCGPQSQVRIGNVVMEQSLSMFAVIPVSDPNCKSIMAPA